MSDTITNAAQGGYPTAQGRPSKVAIIGAVQLVPLLPTLVSTRVLPAKSFCRTLLRKR